MVDDISAAGMPKPAVGGKHKPLHLGIFVLSSQVLAIPHTQLLTGTVKQGGAVRIAALRAAPAHCRTGAELSRCQPPEPAILSLPTFEVSTSRLGSWNGEPVRASLYCLSSMQ